MVLVVGLTGNIACGKSAVGEILKKKSIPVIDSDDIVHELYDKDHDVQEQILQNFGTLNRQEIAKKVFGTDIESQSNKKKLESILHPAVHRKFEEWVKVNSDKPLIVNLVPLLFEANLESRYDYIVCVITDEKNQIERLKKRASFLPDDQILARIRSQMPQDKKVELSDYIIPNNANLEALEQEVDKCFRQITSIKSI
jgi:dephospho-CoA kinase